jgi:hypothetical protein
MSGLGFAYGAGQYLWSSFQANDARFSPKTMCVSGLTTGLRLGIEGGIAEYVTAYIGLQRGKSSYLDPIVAGTTAGAICGIPWGRQGVMNGALRGLGLGLMQAIML